MTLQWIAVLPEPAPAWEEPVNRDRMGFDLVNEPVVAGTRLCVGLSRNDSVVALDTRSGKRLWRTFLDGPVRLPPLYWNEAVFFVSDDGYLRCLDAASGKVIREYAGTRATEEILCDGGVLYLVVGTSEVMRRGGGLYARGEPAPTPFRYIAASMLFCTRTPGIPIIR